jgi:hypothetical protein
MHFQHTTPMPSGISFSPEGILDVPRRKTVSAESGYGSTLVPGEKSPSLTISLQQLYITWKDVIQSGKFEIRSMDESPLVIYQNEPSGNLIIPCWDDLAKIGPFGLRVQNDSTGGEYSITVHYKIRTL